MGRSAIRKYIPALIILLLSAIPLSVFSGWMILSSSNTLNEKYWILDAPFQNYRNAGKYGSDHTRLYHGRLVLGNGAGLKLQPSATVLFDDFIIKAGLKLLYPSSDFNVRLFSGPSGSLTYRLRDALVKKEDGSYYRGTGGKKVNLGGPLNFEAVCKGRRVLISLNGRQVADLTAGVNTLPDIAVYSYDDPVLLSGLRVVSLSGGLKKPVLDEDFKNRRAFKPRVLYFSLLYLSISALLLCLAAALAFLSGSVTSGSLILCSLPFTGAFALFADGWRYYAVSRLKISYLTDFELKALPAAAAYILLLLLVCLPVRLFRPGRNDKRSLVYKIVILILPVIALVKAGPAVSVCAVLPLGLLPAASFMISKPGGTGNKDVIAALGSLAALACLGILTLFSAFVLSGGLMDGGFILFFMLAAMLYCIFLVVIKYRKKIRFAQLLIPAILSALLISAEFAVRFTGADTLWDERYSGINRDYLIDPDLGWVRRDMLEPVSDSKILPVEREAVSAKGFLSVICMGGSSTEAKFALRPDGRYDFPSFMQKELTGTDWKVFNFGVGGWTSFQIKNYLMYYYGRVIARLNPKVFVFYIGANDVQTNLPGGTYRANWLSARKANPAITAAEGLMKSSRLYYPLKTLLKDLVGMKFGDHYLDLKTVKAVPEADSRENLDIIKNTLLSKGVKIVFIGEALKESPLNPELLAFYNNLKSHADNSNVYYFDSYAYLHTMDVNGLFYDNVHLTDKGNQMLAKYIIQRLRENGLL